MCTLSQRPRKSPPAAMFTSRETPCIIEPDILKDSIFQFLPNIAEFTLVEITVELVFMGRDSSVGTATRYRLDGPWIESRWGLDFPHPSRSALEPTQPPIQ